MARWLPHAKSYVSETTILREAHTMWKRGPRGKKKKKKKIPCEEKDGAQGHRSPRHINKDAILKWVLWPQLSQLGLRG